jgi:5-methylcytosine-specific restriction protein A
MPRLYACPNCGTTKQSPGRCTRCSRPTNHHKNQRTNHTTVYNTTRWRTTRARVLQRNDHQCAMCGATATTVDHIEPFTGADDPLAWDEWNLQSLCATCHGRKDGVRARRQAAPPQPPWEVPTQ